jgi:lipopolysaccharide/colanic/teichoic acid biosynthesis glycosyltransferase
MTGSASPFPAPLTTPSLRAGSVGTPAASATGEGAATRQRRLAFGVKRALDIVGGLGGLVVLLPVLLAIAATILVVEGRPVLFVQPRVGRGGRLFRLVKFRTMVRNAEERLPDLAPLSRTAGAAFKLEEDPRVTRLGRSLRRSSLDELPQLWNVLVGEMSLVGPRPAPPREVDRYAEWHRRRLWMKPGMTGLWQVASRLDEHFDQRARLDLAYIDRWSLWLDLIILLRTVPAVLAMTGR